MRSWQLQQARAQLSSVVDAALTEGPQRITRRGKPAVVVVSEEEWTQRAAVREQDRAWAEHLLSFPLEEGELPLPPRRPARVFRDPPFG